MKHILRQATLLLLFLLLIYLLALILATPFMRWSPAGGLDTASAARSPFMTEPKYAFLSRSPLNNSDDKVILLGASNVLAGFRPAQLQGELPSVRVHNLAIGGANMTELQQMVDLVLEVQSPKARQHNVFVLGVWYGLFADDLARWYTPDRFPGDTDLDIERYRYGFYRRTDAGPVPILPAQWLDTGVTLVKPFLLVDRLARDAGKFLRRGGKPVASAEAGQPGAPSAERQRQYLAFWDHYMGHNGQLVDEPFELLSRTISTIRESGGKVVLVDLPLPRWHASASPYDSSYRQQLQKLQQRLDGTSGVAFLSLRDADQSEDFSDEVHPRPPVAVRWAQRLAQALNHLPNLIKQGV
ncbi:hypothetical protein [Rhodoferax sp. U11-2br]|uniref:hypothetical protein n=1 Tax=Rhodoferax sp. U11-2br TaxID=2838878 RepID=UPI001BEA2B79|nr:hypothetical protein [Rhodoferax sp. U11-2br]MBT3068513.1 hypothetical protein [Rhodoferax sp. U11-2br]